jgi:4-amino-4-deoxy-L-arabinose transferase-like glycosyltransferase
MLRMSMVSDSALSRDFTPFDRFWHRFETWTAGAKGPLLAAVVVLISALPGLFALPPLDRDESRFAQATAQMLETGDFINIRYQSEPRDKKPVGIHWLQAASVGAFSSVERRAIWAYRLPSLLGAMVAAAACAWGASAFFGSRAGFFAGAILGASFILSSEAFIAKTDAVLCGATTLSMAALGRLYGASKGIGNAQAGTKALFWLGQAVAILDKGPIGPMVAGLALIALWIADREARWAKSLGWLWGLVLVVVIVGPWAVAITVATDGGFWTGAVGGDLAPKLMGGHETHGAPPGYYALLLPFLFFPSTFILPAALIVGWRDRLQPGVRFALAWLIPSWIVFELLPTKLPHYTLPTYGALAWLAAAALVDPTKQAFGPAARWIGGGLSVLIGLVLAVLAGVALALYGAQTSMGWSILLGILALTTGFLGAAALLKMQIEAGLLACLAAGVLTHITLTAGLAPRLNALWTSSRVAARLAHDHLDPRNGVTTGPVAVVGFAEPSLVFALGSGTELDDAADAADSVSDGQPAIVEKRQDKAFRAALAADKAAAQPVDEVKGINYSTGKRVDLTIWRSLAPPKPDNAP